MATDLIDLGHEQVVFCHDPRPGCGRSSRCTPRRWGRAWAAPASTRTPDRPGAGGRPALSRAMAYKNAVAGLDHGGGKAVIIGDPRRDKTPDLLRAYGRFVESLGGRYVTACDVGTYVADMDVVGEATRWATGRSPERGGAGDSSVLTAYGVFQGMRATAQHVWGEPTLAGRRVAVAGVGKVGRRLTDHLLEDGAEVVVTDVDTDAVQALLRVHPRVRAVDDLDKLVRQEVDVFSPNALGGALDDDTVEALRARVVCGGANNQLVSDGRGRHRRPAAGTRHHLRPRLPRQRRRRHPGQRRAARVRHAARPRAHRDDLRAHPRGAARRRCRRGEPGRGRRPAGRAADRGRWAPALAAR